MSILALTQSVWGYGGGTVYFANKYPALVWPVYTVDAPFYDDHRILLSGTNYHAQLYAGKDATRLIKVGPVASFRSDPFSGYVTGGGVALPMVEPCYPAWVQIRAWEAAGGATFEEAATAGRWTGISSVVFVLNTGGCGGGVPTVSAPLVGLQYPGNPVVVSDPQSTISRGGESATFSVVASGGITLSYQWYPGDKGDTNAPIVGATNATYVTPPLTADASYWVRAQTAVGSVDSSTATVTVYPAEASVLELRRTDDALRLSVHAPQGAYILEESTNLAIGNWGGVTNLIISSSPLEFLTRADTNSSARFYRLKAE